MTSSADDLSRQERLGSLIEEWILAVILQVTLLSYPLLNVFRFPFFLCIE